MKRYRIASFAGLNAHGFDFQCSLAQVGYIELAGALDIEGEVAAKKRAKGAIEAVRLVVVGSTKRPGESTSEFTAGSKPKTQDNKSPTGVGFNLTLKALPEWRQGLDFALELHVRTTKRWYHLQTTTFVQDDLRKDALFVVGSPRSGTTIIGDSLRKTFGGSAGFGESHLLPLIGSLKNTVSQYHRSSAAATIPTMMLHHVNPHLLGEQMGSVIKQQYHRLFGEQSVIDKTPGGAMIWSLPDIQRLWPDARVIFAKRRGIENVVSRLKKFPDTDFEAHCIQWRNCMHAWQQVKEQLNHTLEIDQFDILTQPEDCAERIAAFLSLSRGQCDELAGYLVTDRPEKTAASVDSIALDLQKLDWSAAQKDIFRNTCGQDLEQWGYSLDSSYYLVANA